MSMASPGEGGGVDQDALITGMTAARRRALQQLPQDLSRILSSESLARSRPRRLFSHPLWTTLCCLVWQTLHVRVLLVGRCPAASTGTTSVNELLEGLTHLGVTREQLLTSLRQLKDMLILDERTGVVRSRSALAKAQQQQQAAGGGGGAGGAAAVAVGGGGAADMVE